MDYPFIYLAHVDAVPDTILPSFHQAWDQPLVHWIVQSQWLWSFWTSWGFSSVFCPVALRHMARRMGYYFSNSATAAPHFFKSFTSLELFCTKFNLEGNMRLKRCIKSQLLLLFFWNSK